MRKVVVVALVGVVSGLLVFGTTEASAERGEKCRKEEKVTLAQVPAAVSNALVTATAGGTIEEIVKEVKDGKVFYEADFTKDGKSMEIKLDESGKVLKIKESDDDKDEAETEEHETSCLSGMPFLSESGM